MKPWPVDTHSTHTNPTDHADQLHTLFSRLPPQDVEDFYISYQQWRIQKHIHSLQEQIATIQQRIHKNARLVADLQPSSAAHATLARLRSHGVEDIDVLDRLLEHDDSWLHHILELLEQCEHLGFIQDDYTQWCEYALEGAYDWITSITITTQDTHDDLSNQQINEMPASSMSIAETIVQEGDILPPATEEELLQKLMSDEDDETVKRPALQSPIAATPTDDETNALETLHSNMQANSDTSPVVSTTQQQAAITHPLPAITQPLPDSVGAQSIAPAPEKESAVGTRCIAPTPEEDDVVGARCIAPAPPPTSITVTPHRNPLWRFFNLLARFFFPT